VQYVSNAEELADSFARAVPEHEFSIAELQGYLLEWKMRPLDAVRGVEQWAEGEREIKRERVARAECRKQRIAAAKAKEQVQLSSAVIAGIGTAMAQGNNMYGRPPPPVPFSPISDVSSPEFGKAVPAIPAWQASRKKPQRSLSM
jgi:mitochondrial chaperone BCS1